MLVIPKFIILTKKEYGYFLNFKANSFKFDVKLDSTHILKKHEDDKMRRLLLTIIILGYHTMTLADTPKIVFATEEWMPYISTTEPGHGKFAEIVSAVFKEMGMEATYIFAPWKRVEAIVEKGEAFAAIPYTYTEERTKTFNFSDPIMNSDSYFFYNKKKYPNGIQYVALKDLNRYQINGVIGNWYESFFAQEKLKVDYVATDEQLITKLYFNRVDLIVAEELTAWALIKKLYPRDISQFGVTKKPLKSTTLHLMVSKKYPHAVELTQKFNATFKKMREKLALGR